jgi:hypothetical protein
MSGKTCYSDNDSKYTWENCYSGSNNYNFNSPPLMADGRNWASWQPEAVINNRIQQKEGIHNNWSYRRYLQNNGIKIMNYNSMESCYDLGLDPHVKTDRTPSQNVPFKFKGIFDTSKPGFGYCNSDLKNPYLTSEQLNSRLIAPVINPADYQNLIPGVKIQ